MNMEIDDRPYPSAYREDLSRLVPMETWQNTMHVFEPLSRLVVDEDLSPYCCLADKVHFYRWDDRFHQHRIAEAEHHWRSGDRVGVRGEPWELLSARCVYRQGQWCMRWLARRVVNRPDCSGPVETGEDR